MTLRQVAERLGISFARVKQLETKALEKLKKRSGIKDILF
jgi:DNA-directed RNA polymerase sigma subunit (sigma70/sigma32)